MALFHFDLGWVLCFVLLRGGRDEKVPTKWRAGGGLGGFWQREVSVIDEIALEKHLIRLLRRLPIWLLKSWI
jgi:hypothetical protein